MSRVKAIGIIAEDDTDYQAIKILLKRITGNDKLTCKPKLGAGGKVFSKTLAWANELAHRECNLLLVVHDLDSRNLDQFKEELTNLVSGCAILNHFVCIPVQELESWFLADPEGIKNAFGLRRCPRIEGLPETIPSPKEYLEKKVFDCSNKRVLYSTKQNARIAEHVSLDCLERRCGSFKDFKEFISRQQFAAS